MYKKIFIILSIVLIGSNAVYGDSDNDNDGESLSSYSSNNISNEESNSQTITSDNKESIVKLYVATFDRAPDADGLNYWLYQSKLSIEDTATSFFDQDETKTKYPDGLSTTEFVTRVYQNLFKRDPDTEGLHYWVTALDSGSIAKSTFILAAINGALGDDAVILSNKTQVGLAFVDSGSNDYQNAIDIMKNITQDSSTVSSALGTLPATTPSNTGAYTLLAWNDLGMHCMDGNDYSIFSILPPYNNLIAQLIEKGSHPKHINSGVTITYESAVSLDGKWNTTSSTKTNFWTYAGDLFGSSPSENVGLANNPVQSLTPHTMTYESTNNWWKAEGIPTSPRNDDGSYNMYPMVKVVAKSASGQILAETTTVLPVSDEMDCKKCHASNSNTSAKPSAGWVSIADAQKDYKLNILRLHDQKHPNAVSNNLQALANKGWNYNSAGLETTANSGTPILCASCHKSNALPNTGVNGIKPLTQALHSKHANVTDPLTNMKLNDATNRNACYSCHPGATTQCLRGAMGSAKNADGSNKMQCQSCHGTMSAVGGARDGWFDEPNCQSCHQNGKRETVAVTNMLTGTLRAAVDNRFATSANHPATGKSLYRFSTGHGGLQCSACHGSTHAIYPSSKPEDNLQSIHIQGHAGTIGECTACHTSMPNTSSSGPHGMHSIGDSWVRNHQDVAEHGGATQCASCHGADYRGSNLSKTMSARTLSVEHGSKSFPAGHKVSCYDCHNGPGGGDGD